ncbi:MAG: hypothetical protein GY780_08865, partial [bacterium]|nr:hypothetical protein [bacterium]
MWPAFDFHLLLASVTGIYCLLVWFIWQKSQNLAFPLGFFFLYYWSLSGAWDLVSNLAGARSGKRYHYLFDKLFPVELNGDYFLTLVYYSIFLILTAFTVYLVLSLDSKKFKTEMAAPRFFHVSHFRLILGSLICLGISLYLVKDQLLQAMLMNVSGYKVTAQGEHTSGLFRLHQSFNNLMVIPPAIGIPAMVSGDSGRFLRGSKGIRPLAGYSVLIFILLVYAMVMGNKHELFTGMVSGVVLYLVNLPRPRLQWFAGISALAFLGT